MTWILFLCVLVLFVMQGMSMKVTNPVNPINLIATHPVIPHWLQSEEPTSKNDPRNWPGWKSRSVITTKTQTVCSDRAPSPEICSSRRPEVSRTRPIQSTFVSHLEAGRGSVKEALSPIEHNCWYPPTPSLTTHITEEPGPDQHVCECFHIMDTWLKGASSPRKTREEGTLHLGLSFSC